MVEKEFLERFLKMQKSKYKKNVFFTDTILVGLLIFSFFALGTEFNFAPKEEAPTMTLIMFASLYLGYRFSYSDRIRVMRRIIVEVIEQILIENKGSSEIKLYTDNIILDTDEELLQVRLIEEYVNSTYFVRESELQYRLLVYEFFNLYKKHQKLVNKRA